MTFKSVVACLFCVALVAGCNSTNHLADGDVTAEDVVAAGELEPGLERSSGDAGAQIAPGETVISSGGAAGGALGGSGTEDAPSISGGTRPGGTVQIGVRYIDAESVATAAQLFGLSGADVGDPKRFVEIMFDHVNRSGGIAGRKVAGVYHAVDAVQLALSSAGAEEEACRALTEDADVFAIVSPGPTNQAFPDCTSKKKVPVVNVSYNYYPSSVMRRYGKYFYFPTSMDSDRSHRAFIDGLASAGFFGKGHKLGLVRLNTDVHEQVLNESVKPALARRGLRLHEERALRNAQDQEGFTSAVLRFRQVGVTNVIFIESAGQLALGFTQRAEDQRYRPRYGFSSHASLFGIASNTPPEQLANAVGVGWVPASDAVGANGPELGPRAKWCLDLMRAGGSDVDTDGARTVALWTCDVVLFLKEGLDRASAFTIDGFAGSVAALGSAFQPAGTYATSFGPGTGGVSQVRRLGYQPVCRCFRWTSAPYAIG